MNDIIPRVTDDPHLFENLKVFAADMLFEGPRPILAVTARQADRTIAALEKDLGWDAYEAEVAARQRGQHDPLDDLCYWFLKTANRILYPIHLNGVPVNEAHLGWRVHQLFWMCEARFGDLVPAPPDTPSFSATAARHHLRQLIRFLTKLRAAEIAIGNARPILADDNTCLASNGVVVDVVARRVMCGGTSYEGLGVPLVRLLNELKAAKGQPVKAATLKRLTGIARPDRVLNSVRGPLARIIKHKRGDGFCLAA